MEYVALGRTDLLVSRTSFSAMRLDCAEIEVFGEGAAEKAAHLVHQAYDGGINFFVTSRTAPVSEKRLGQALHGIRQNVYLATKTNATTGTQLKIDLCISLDNLESDTVDLYFLENPKDIPLVNGVDGVYNALTDLKHKGSVKYIGIATEDLDFAKKVVDSGLFDVIQFPFNLLSGEEVEALVKRCAEKEIGFIAKQPLCGGIVSNIPLALGYLHQIENVVPVWSARTPEELQQILYFQNHPPVIDEQFKEEAQKLREFFN